MADEANDAHTTASEPPELGSTATVPGATIEPPRTWSGTLLYLGPGLILVGNIVGSGELIATPALAAEAGFAFLWLILFSCFIKVFFQIEIGRYAISAGQTTLESFNELPGPKLGVHPILWFWLAMFLATLVQIGGMCGGVAQALRIAVPVWSNLAGYEAGSEAARYLDDTTWAILTGLSIIFLLAFGRYRLVERVALVLVTLFTIVTFYSLFQLQTTERSVTWGDIAEGFSFTLPDGGDPARRTRLLGLALMAFGITGVGASELVAYPYWCLEKGYGRFVGRRPEGDDSSWVVRARGWVRVMVADAWLSMIVFTIATVAFYLLGAALLYARFKDDPGNVPTGPNMVSELSFMYATAFGPASRYIFLFGAFCVLYSTFFIATAANARMLADFLALLGCYDRKNDEARALTIRILCIAFPIFSTAAYLFLEKPVLMVMLSGIMQALMLPLIGIAVLVFAYDRTDKRLRGGVAWYVMLWISLGLMTVASLYGGYNAVIDYIDKAKTAAGG